MAKTGNLMFPQPDCSASESDGLAAALALMCDENNSREGEDEFVYDIFYPEGYV